jgi:peptidoglycan/LPS O-acetylase OafA/YrhL
MSEYQKTMRNSALDGIRGWAAVAVVFFHTISGMDAHVLSAPANTFYGEWTTTVLTLVDGSTAVVLFFILSGCVLTVSLQRTTRVQGYLRSAFSFVVKRILRIYPSAIACIAAMAFFYWLLSFWQPQLFLPFPLHDVLTNMLLVDWSVHGATWTLNMEIFAVPLMLVFGLASVAIGNAAIYVFVLAAIAIHFGPSNYFGFLQCFNMIYFAAGCLVTTPIGKASTKLVSVYAALAFTLFCRVFIRHELFDIWLIQALFGFLFVSHIYYEPNTKLAKVLSRPLSQFMGRISFSLYLWNVPVLYLIFPIYRQYVSPVSNYPVEAGSVMATVVILVTIPIAVVSMRLIEHPFIALGRKIGDLWPQSLLSVQLDPAICYSGRR